MHILKSLKRTGKAAVILPHGVLFRGNAEGTIRENLIRTGYIKGIIGLPTNLFYGTGIPACIIIIDKEDADERTGIFMIDASHDFEKTATRTVCVSEISIRSLKLSMNRLPIILTMLVSFQ